MMIREDNFSIMKKVLELSLESGAISAAEYQARLEQALKSIELQNQRNQKFLSSGVNKYLKQMERMKKLAEKEHKITKDFMFI